MSMVRRLAQLVDSQASQNLSLHMEVAQLRRNKEFLLHHQEATSPLSQLIWMTVRRLLLDRDVVVGLDRTT